jgi:hypothetical protein
MLAWSAASTLSGLAANLHQRALAGPPIPQTVVPPQKEHRPIKGAMSVVEDIHEPVELYRTVFKAAHARNTSEYFEDLLRRSGVDEQANAITVKELRTLEQQIGNVNSSRTWWNVLRGAVVVGGVVCLILGIAMSQPLWLIGVVGAGALSIAKLNPMIKDVDQRIKLLKTQRDKTLEDAWAQMAPLNELYDWDTVGRLVKRTVPRIELDPYFANGRRDDLRNTFGWTDEFNENRSVVIAHSGVLNGNPFVVARTLNHWMGAKTYHGELYISWSERVKDSDGKWTTATRHQTLHASVTKPFPEYGHSPIVIYGNEAAPDLSFSRVPSKLSHLEEGLLNNWKKGRAIKRLEAQSRNIAKGKDFTIMANREFEALFGATNRDHEVQFRLLFTPLAQQEMVKLLKDKDVGYGDDFSFAKHRMINVVEPGHLAKADLNTDPAMFRACELAHARKFFNEFHNDFFKSLYFGLAPLLAIPLYQQHRSHADIWADVESRTASIWEHESIANYFGEQTFQHPECITRSILKTQSSCELDGTQTVRVAANGYKGINRVAYVSVHGGDGHNHRVPVEWIDYIEVRQESDLVVRELANTESDEQSSADPAPWHAHFLKRGINPSSVVLRRSIASALLGN